MIQNLLDSSLSESHTIRTSQHTMQEQLLASFRRLHEAQGQTQVALRNLDHAIHPLSRPQPRTANTYLDGQHESSRPTAVLQGVQRKSSSIAGMTVQQIERKVCRRDCSCQCHMRVQWSTYPVLKNVIGSLFLGYSTPRIVLKCDKPSCHGYQGAFATVSYVFPQWFLQRIVMIAISYANRYGLELSIRTIRERRLADSIWIHVDNGNLAMVQSLFKRGEASPFDVVEGTGETILEVCSTPNST